METHGDGLAPRGRGLQLFHRMAICDAAAGTNVEVGDGVGAFEGRHWWGGLIRAGARLGSRRRALKVLQGPSPFARRVMELWRQGVVPLIPLCFPQA